MNPESRLINIPTAIIVAAVIIGWALIWNNRGSMPAITENNRDTIKFAIAPVDNTDHILGNPQAPLVIIEYSDMSCPFCKVFHETLKTLMDGYGKEGKIAWVYRHLPITSLHPLAYKEAIASECAAKVGGTSTYFWDYTDRLFATKTQNSTAELSILNKIASDMKLDTASFQSCLETEATKSKVDQDFNNGVEISGGRPGTPMSMLVLRTPMPEKTETSLVSAISRLPRGYDQLITISSDRRIIKIEGAFPLEAMKAIIDEVVK